MSTVPIHHSSDHAAGPGADPGSGHREGQLTNRSCAQVSDSRIHTHTHICTHKYKGISSRYNINPVLHQVVLSGRSDCVLGCRAGDRPLLCCRGNREVQETPICGAVGFKSCREVLLCKVVRERV